jgi:hypothetical protein
MRGIIAAAVVVATTAFVHAQPAVTSPQPAPALQPAPAPAAPAEQDPVCIRGGDTCKTLLLLETTWGVKPVVATSAGNSPGGDLGLEAGVLVNTGDSQGFGGSLGMHFVSEAEAVPFVIRGRYRHYLSHHTNVDASLGLLKANVNRGGNGATFQLAMERSGKVAVVLDVDVYRSHRDGENRNVVEVGLAVKFCGLWALPSALFTLLIAAAGRGTG